MTCSIHFNYIIAISRYNNLEVVIDIPILQNKKYEAWS